MTEPIPEYESWRSEIILALQKEGEGKPEKSRNEMFWFFILKIAKI